MSAVIRPRGPLPRRVYWFRRSLVLLVLVLLVVVVVKVFGGGDADSEAASPATPAAATAAQAKNTASASPTASPSGAAGGSPSPSATPKPEAAEQPTPAPKPSPTKRPLPKPDGPCEPSDVLVTPVVTGTTSSGSVDITLAVSTVESAACTFAVTPTSVFVTISGEDRTAWASQHCGAAMPSKEVVARRTKAAEVVLRWNGRESAVGCPETPWVESGEYTVAALARGAVNIRKTSFSLKTAG